MTDPAKRAGDEHLALGEEFVSRLSHALRTPVAVIIGYAELLDARDDEELRRDAPARIREAAYELANVIDDLLIVFAADARALAVYPDALDLEPVVADVVRALRNANSNEFSCAVECSRWPTVAADPQYIPRILRNLLLNACKRSPAGGRIRVRVQQVDGFAAVWVTDEGPPLTEEQARRAFERFSAAEFADHDARATGLELYKVRRLVELHGGSVSAKNGPNGGATFAFTIPLAGAGDAA